MAYYNLDILFYILALNFLLNSFYFNKPILYYLHIATLLIAFILNAVRPFIWFINNVNISIFNLHQSLVLLSLLLCLLYLILYFYFHKQYTGLFILPMIILCGMMNLYTYSEKIQNSTMMDIWLYSHIPLVLFGMFCFIISTVSGIIYFFMEKQLKTKKLGKILSKLPALYNIDKINSSSLFIGFVTYSAGMLIAIGWLKMGGSEIENKADTKIVLSAIAWVMFSCILIAKTKFNITPKQTALASILGFICIIVIYTGVIGFLTR